MTLVPESEKPTPLQNLVIALLAVFNKDFKISKLAKFFASHSAPFPLDVMPPLMEMSQTSRDDGGSEKLHKSFTA